MVVMAMKKLVVMNLMIGNNEGNNDAKGGTYGVGESQQGGAVMSWDSNYYARQDDHGGRLGIQISRGIRIAWLIFLLMIIQVDMRITRGVILILKVICTIWV